MSHVSAIKTVIRDLDALKSACAIFGLEFREGQTTYGWYGHDVGDHRTEDSAVVQGVPADQLGKCSHAIHLPGCAYEIGVATVNGVARLLYDSWGPGQKLLAAAGPGLQKLVQAYGVFAAQNAMKTLQNKGFRLVKVAGVVGEPMQLQYQRG